MSVVTFPPIALGVALAVFVLSAAAAGVFDAFRAAPTRLDKALVVGVVACVLVGVASVVAIILSWPI